MEHFSQWPRGRIDVVKLDLILPRKVFTQGETIEGKVILTCDKPTNFRSFVIVFEGKLTSKGTGFETSGKGRTSQKTYTQTYGIHRQQISYGENSAFDSGTQQFGLRFTIPEDAKVSYSGHNGQIEYTVSAIVDESWKSTVTKAERVMIIQPINDVPDLPAREVAEHEGTEILEMETETHK
jgi:hypothetical protein